MEKQEYANMYRQENDFFWYKTLHQLILSILRKEKNNDLNIFDAGCGTGRLMELLSEFGNVAGIDYSSEAVSFSKQRGIQNVEQENLNHWKGTKNQYDVITSIDVLYHSAIKNEKEILANFYESLRPNGLLILNLAAFDILKREHDKVVHTKRRYRKKPLVKTLESIGFEIEKATYRMPHLFLIILLQKTLQKISKPKESQSDVQEVSKSLNSVFSFLGKIENDFLLNIGNIPFGSSVFIVAKKK